MFAGVYAPALVCALILIVGRRRSARARRSHHIRLVEEPES
jgi:hypothetical protein